ncbi:hypothetical protein Ddye_015415 [Dipteronia dyeriana]|uniref:Wall-associated receptor kinase C-terminal domain-containing protein n=1 Tax=Dipteronia dyeriana TaxID=168575 RepID=A0AAD9WYG9_9ROSI|nr:hypothetical protein Ddye_015415 [Dipteronia dyeriana]
MTIARDDLWNNYSPGKETKDTVVLEHFLLKYGPNVGNLSFFHCQEIQPQYPGYFNCSAEGEDITGFYIVSVPDLPTPIPNTCQVGIKVPVIFTALDDHNGTENLGDALNKGFEVEYLLDSTPCSDCYSSGGICESSLSDPGQFLCSCRDYDPQSYICPPPGMDSKLVLAIVFLFDLIAFALAVAVEQRRSTMENMNLEDFLIKPRNLWLKKSTINSYNSLNWLPKIAKVLKQVKQLGALRKTCFRHLLVIPKEVTFSAGVMHNLLLRQICIPGVTRDNEFHFLLGGKVAKFTKREFCLVTGLKFRVISDIFLKTYHVISGGIHARYFGGMRMCS